MPIAFFRSIPHTLPFMDEPRFRKAFEDYYGPQSSDDVVDVCCTYLVIAIGARSCSDDSGICTNHFSAAWSMYGEIIALPYLSSVQCLVLMVNDPSVCPHLANLVTVYRRSS